MLPDSIFKAQGLLCPWTSPPSLLPNQQEQLLNFVLCRSGLCTTSSSVLSRWEIYLSYFKTAQTVSGRWVEGTTLGMSSFVSSSGLPSTSQSLPRLPGSLPGCPAPAVCCPHLSLLQKKGSITEGLGQKSVIIVPGLRRALSEPLKASKQPL